MELVSPLWLMWLFFVFYAYELTTSSGSLQSELLVASVKLINDFRGY